MVAYRRFAPQNLPSLSMSERTAFAGLQQYLPLFEQHIYDESHTRFHVFDSTAERDAFFEPDVGDACLVRSDGSVAAALYVYGEWLTTGFNVVERWFPYDLGWTHFTPTLTNMTLGDGSAVARYRREGGDCHVKYKFTLGATSAMGTSPQFTLPFQAVSHLGGTLEEFSAQVVATDSGTAVYRGQVRYGSATTVICLVGNVGGTILVDSGITAASPMVWTTNDSLSIPYMVYAMDMENLSF